MTDDEATALGKRLVACKGFQPMRGMLDMQGRTWDQSLLWRWSNDVDVPDLRDPATLGCVLAMVREAHGRHCYTQACGGYWTVQREDTEHAWGDHCDTEAAALVAALEAAP